MALNQAYRAYLQEILKEVGQLEVEEKRRVAPELVRRGVYGTPAGEVPFRDIGERFGKERTRLTAETLRNLLEREEAEKSKEKWWWKQVGETRRQEQVRSEEQERARRWQESLMSRERKRQRRSMIQQAGVGLGLGALTGGIAGATGMFGEGVNFGGGALRGLLMGQQGVGTVAGYQSMFPRAPTTGTDWMQNLLAQQQFQPGFMQYGNQLDVYGRNPLLNILGNFGGYQGTLGG